VIGASPCPPIDSSATGDKVCAVCGTETGQCCTHRSGSNSSPGTKGSPRAFGSLYAARIPKADAGWRRRSNMGRGKSETVLHCTCAQ
jgi:hypothetical protein